MSDLADQTDAREEVSNEARIYAIRRNSVIEIGIEGECSRCGNQSLRLVRNTCAPCRDRYKLP